MDRALELNLKHDWADLGDVRLHYVSGGQGPAIVFLHGWPQTWYMWRDVLPGLMQRYRVVAVDLRGLGESSRPAAGYDTKTVSQDVWRLMHDVLGERSFHVVAHDWGGPVAYALAAQHRDAITSMAIFDAPVPGDGSVMTALGRWHFGFHAEADLPEALIAGREELYLRHMYRKGGARPDAVSEEAQREYLRTYTQPGAMRAGFNYYREMARDAKDNQVFIKQGKLPMPILVYGGGAQNVGRGLYAMDSWQRVARDVRGGVAEGCGHWIPEERPAWVVERLLEFFTDVDRRRAAAARPVTTHRFGLPAQLTQGNAMPMFYETIDTALIDVESLPWMPFAPYSDTIFLKLIKVDPVSGQWITLLKLPPHTELPMHHHAGTVMVWTIAGQWKYIEHDWVAGPGSFVFETAGSRHTPISVGEDEVITLNIVQGDWNLMSPEGAVLAIENWKLMMDRYLNFCRSQDIEPVDVSSFSG
ncbi:alpha/beta fold hydrolase [Variovorax sp. YR216]|uniref:alpha/beta fold hydrolase n=1 Tax=Variovorax sp. YR216 TaxID=1882828 RepID=UPI0008951FA6|nr:Pimeloyl-ACP methyl ester carboxylesterase [Variovorax sp. YR216]